MNTPSKKHVVLFDFHNTLATCDPWLELEIRTLPALSLERLIREGVLNGGSADNAAQATALFRELRQTVRDSGVELSAFEGTKRVLAHMGFHPPDAALEGVIAELEQDCLRSVEMVAGAEVRYSSLKDAGTGWAWFRARVSSFCGEGAGDAWAADLLQRGSHKRGGRRLQVRPGDFSPGGVTPGCVAC